jgi:glycosyltransferase involved in cell wall biosynthesis
VIGGRSVPDVSVVVPTRNEEPRIAAALASIGRDEGVIVEILVVDDGSTDGTVAVTRSISDPRIRVLSTVARGRGPGPARNVGLDHASGRWIALLDADDAWAPGRLPALIEAAEREGADLVADDVLIEMVDPIDGSVTPVSTLFTDRGLGLRGECRSLDLDLFVRCDLGPVMPLIDRSLILENGLRYRAHATEDFAFTFRCIRAAANPILVSDPMYRYRKEVTRSTVSSSTSDFWMGAAETTAEVFDDAGDLPGRVRSSLRRRLRVQRRRSRYVGAKAAFQRREWASALRQVVPHPSLLLVGLESLPVRVRRRRWRSNARRTP